MNSEENSAWSPAALTVPLSWVYGVGAALFHGTWNLRKPRDAGAPVISVGNLTVGGNGKTPFVIALAKLLMDSDLDLAEENAVAILSRGYGRKSSEQVLVEVGGDWRVCGDEPILMKRACPSALVISYRERVRAAKTAVEKFGSKVILLDDGFQHRVIRRDLNIVLLDSARPLGNGRQLPAGPLRERVSGLRRSDVIASVGEGNEAMRLANKFGKTHIRALARTDLSKISPSPFENRCFLLTGIARPERMVAMLKAEGIGLLGHRAFADHAEFSDKDISSVQAEASALGATLALTTEKDLVRLGGWRGGIQLSSVPYEIEIVNKAEVSAGLRNVMDGRMTRR